MKRIVWIVGLLAILGIGYGAFRAKHKAASAPIIEYTTVSRGNLESTISTTGEIKPVSTVEVGTQVSGIINKIYVDFNDVVRKGQVLAVLDTTLLASAVRESRANYIKSEAEYEKAKKEYSYYKELLGHGYISEYELLGYETAAKTTGSAFESSKISLERANQNLAYAVIRSPISGKVIDRSVEEGQTVAASFSTPTLFTIAGDLAQIEIHAKVDESDIGQITKGQNVRFSVETHFDKTFEGVVREVRLQPETISNVVTYTAVVDARNDEELLLPGMTATLDFIVAERTNVLLVANSALRVKPSESLIHPAGMTGGSGPGSAKADMGKPGAAPSGNGAPPQGAPSGNGAAPQAGAERATAQASASAGGNGNGETVLWVSGQNGGLRKIPVEKGITDGKMTEITSDAIREGMQVISSIAETTETSSSKRADMRMMGPMMRR